MHCAICGKVLDEITMKNVCTHAHPVIYMTVDHLNNVLKIGHGTEMQKKVSLCLKCAKDRENTAPDIILPKGPVKIIKTYTKRQSNDSEI